MDNPMDKKVSRRSLLGGSLKAAAALGAGPALSRSSSKERQLKASRGLS